MNGSLPTPSTADWVELLKTLADPIRLRILRLLEHDVHHGKDEGGGLSVGELADILKLPQSTVSRHLKTLVDGGVIAATREGTSMFYRLADSADQNSIRQLRQLSKSHLDHDPLAKTDAQRLAHVLRNRTPAPADAFFGAHAPHWDSLRAQWFGDTFHLEALLALLDPNWTVADVGTGTGTLLPLLSPHVKNVIGIDPSPAMLKNARQRVRDLRLPNVELRQGAAENLPLPDHSVDVALLILVLAYTADPPAALRELRRVLKPDGTLLIVDLQPHTVTIFRDKLSHRHMGFPQPELESWLASAGFTSPRYHPLPSPTARSKDTHTAVPDLFALRAQATPNQ